MSCLSNAINREHNKTKKSFWECDQCLIFLGLAWLPVVHSLCCSAGYSGKCSANSLNKNYKKRQKQSADRETELETHPTLSVLNSNDL